MKKILSALALLCALPATAQTVWALTDSSGNVTGFYANAAPVPAPPNCCTQMSMSDSRMTAFLNPAPTAAQEYAAALNGGLAITSTSTPTLNGTYSVTTQAQGNLAAIAASVGASQGLPNGATSIVWLDANGVGHTFTSAQFLSLADAVRNYVYNVLMTYYALQDGTAATWPAATATIP